MDCGQVPECRFEEKWLILGQKLVDDSESLLDQLPLLTGLAHTVFLVVESADDVGADLVVEHPFEVDPGVGERDTDLEDGFVFEK